MSDKPKLCETCAHRYKPAGPFVAEDSGLRKCTDISFMNIAGEGFSVSVKRDEAERLAEWLNGLWAEREVGE